MSNDSSAQQAPPARSPSSQPVPPPAQFLTAPPPRPLWAKILFVVGIVGLLLLAFYWQALVSHARTGASYGARVGCSCRFIGGRALGDCRKDFVAGMGLITLSDDSQAKSVTARFPLLAKQTATYREGWGCVLERWED